MEESRNNRCLWCRRAVKSALAVLVLSFILGAFSVSPFTKLYLPWLMFHQWQRARFPAAADVQCMDRLKAEGIQFQTGHMSDEDVASGCVMDTTVILRSLDLKLTNIAFEKQPDIIVVDCALAEKMLFFIRNLLVPAARRYFGSDPVVFLSKGGFSCRGQQTFTTIKSEHSYGTAIDFAGVRLADGREILVEKDYNSSGQAGEFLREIEERGCSFFGSSLGPGFNDFHHDHFHWSTGFPRMCR